MRLLELLTEPKSLGDWFYLVIVEGHCAGAVALHVGVGGVGRDLRVLLRDLLLRSLLDIDLGRGGAMHPDTAGLLLSLDCKIFIDNKNILKSS